MWATYSARSKGHSGRLEAHFADDEELLVEFLAEVFFRLGDEDGLEELLELAPDRRAEVLATAWELALDQGDSVRATELFEEALASGEFDGDWLDDLVDLDPVAALRLFDDQVGAMSATDAALFGGERARLLLEAGRTAEAGDVYLALLADTGFDSEWVQGLVEADPDRAEEFLVAMRDDEEYGFQATRQLAALYADEGRTEEARALVVGLLETSPKNRRLLDQYLELDRAAALAHIAGLENTDGLDGRLWRRLGDAYLEEGRIAQAVDAWRSALSGDIDQPSILERVYEHDPRYVEELEERSLSRRDDEDLGDLADFHWSQGRADKAADLWREALRLDPSDWEWRDKLRAVALGLDPL